MSKKQTRSTTNKFGIGKALIGAGIATGLLATGALEVGANRAKLVTDCVIEVKPGDSLEGVAGRLHVNHSDITNVTDRYGNPISYRGEDVNDGPQAPTTPQVQPGDLITAKHVEVTFCPTDNNGQVAVKVQ